MLQMVYVIKNTHMHIISNNICDDGAAGGDQQVVVGHYCAKYSDKVTLLFYVQPSSVSDELQQRQQQIMM